MDVKIEYKGRELRFNGDMTLNQFDYIKIKFATKNGAPNLNQPNWWYKKTPFGLFLLKQLCTNCKIGELEIETKEDWIELYPFFKHYFPTISEYANIKVNVAFWNGRSEKLIEDSYYIKWAILNNYGNIRYNELSDMPFKEAMMLYYYVMLNNIFIRAEAYSQTIHSNFRKKMEEEETKKMYG